jgi:hypothetical protein
VDEQNEQTQQKSPDQRSTEFVAVSGGPETTSAEALLVSAYLVMWAILLVFVVFTWRRIQGLDRRLAELDRALDRGAVNEKK